MRHARLFATLALSVLLTAPLSAQGAGDYRSEVLREIDIRAERFISLAEAIPAGTYTWRPGEGVRSVSELLLHVAASNYGLVTRYGAEIPAAVRPQTLERSTTEKSAVVRQLRESFDHLRQAVRNAPADPEPMQPWFGGVQLSNRALGMAINSHLGEHLGQLIAYARVNGVRPPWSGEG